jgi:hypothetical protein
MSFDQQLASEIERATKSISKKLARQMMEEMREAAEAKAKARKEDQRRRFALGGAVIAAGMGEWELAEVVGVLLDGRDRVAGSPTMRLGMRKRGEAAIGGSSGARGQPLTMPTLH